MKSPANKTRKALSRRDFLKSFTPVKIEAQAKKPALSENPVAPQRFALDALRNLSEPVLRQMVPVLRRDLAATIQDAALAFQGEGGEEGLVPLRPEACAVVRLFDGLRTLEQIGSALEIERAGQPGTGFLLAREAFLALAARGVYHPAGPPVSAAGVGDAPRSSPIGECRRADPEKMRLNPGINLFLRKGSVSAPLLLLIGLSLVFFIRYAHLQFASDDLDWLRGNIPTVFDQYRILPRLAFRAFHYFIGVNPAAALGLIFFFHAANALLVYRLSRSLMDSKIAGRVAVAVFAINPITLSALTWFSCFSYVMGTTFALASLIVFSRSRWSAHPWCWWWGAVVLYGMALLSSHETLFLPVVMCMLSWTWGRASWKRGLMQLGATSFCAVLVHAFIYRFDLYGVDEGRLLDFGFLKAFASSILSFPVCLGLAFPLSFLARTSHFLMICFSEPTRWALTLAVAFVGGMILRSKAAPSRRLWIALASICMALITPYILRLYLMPAGVNYDPAYVLGGRVFYLAFVGLALVWGALMERVWSLMNLKRRRLFAAVCLVAYLHALLFLYTPADFMGLSVIKGASHGLRFPPPWNPYHGQTRPDPDGTP